MKKGKSIMETEVIKFLRLLEHTPLSKNHIRLIFLETLYQNSLDCGRSLSIVLGETSPWIGQILKQNRDRPTAYLGCVEQKREYSLRLAVFTFSSTYIGHNYN